ncbi:MAG TPA: hypothetical protein VMH34_03310 [Gammaproteobacteria bacterium]|nr:hypothetical protein [Gammaproteobacteria bacterium]
MNSARQNLVTLLSLLVAILALAYSAWRQGVNEHNHNMRDAAFRTLTELNELQLLADYAHYEKDTERGNPINGWARVGLINDLSMLQPATVQVAAANLKTVWGREWPALRDSEESNRQVTAAVQAMRESVLAVLQQLH